LCATCLLVYYLVYRFLESTHAPVKIVERLLAAIPLMIGVAVIVFLFMRLTPGDPVDIMMGQGGAVSAGRGRAAAR
jgi:ABC-type dipeptide/oligopeptide/nickel transport system permease component